MRLWRLPDCEAPLFSLAGLPVAIILALALLWPVVATGHLSGFNDSNSYVRGGDAIWRIVNNKIFPPRATDSINTEPDSALSADYEAQPLGDTTTLYGRSITYATLFVGVVRTAGPVAMSFLQALLVAFAILAMINQRTMERPVLLGGGLVMLVFLSQAAWLSVYLMPDVLGAIILIFAALLVSRFDRFHLGQKLFLTLLAAFAVSAHYGNIPLAFASVCTALLWRHFEHRSSGRKQQQGSMVVVAGLFVVLAAPLLNMTASFAVLGETSMTPLRPPVVLARSLEDGPARWYLENQCAENVSDYCAVFDEEVVDNHFDFLWGLDTRDAEAVQSVRENEWNIVLSAALEYPLQQIAAIARNSAEQFMLVSDVGMSMEWNGTEFVKTGASKLRPISKRLMFYLTLLSGLLLAGLLVSGRLNRSQAQILTIVTFGLIINAFIFGALSAPFGRYQARVVWLLPLLLVLFVAENEFRGSRGTEVEEI